MSGRLFNLEWSGVRIATMVLLAAVVVAVSSSAGLAQVSGAIFTTDDECIGTDLNIYKFKEDVYLDGGPRKVGSAGLPTGEYYVQVTSPSGILLGTSVGHPMDETPVEVDEFGEFVTCYQLCEILIIPGAVTKGRGRGNGNGNDCGYADTPNPGGVYKAWISQNPEFPNSESKTDNFKVKKGKPTPQTEIRAIKFYDSNGDGIQDAGEPVIPDWHIELRLKSDDSLVDCQLTDGGGEVVFLVDQDGTEYVVLEVAPGAGFYPLGDYLNTTPVSIEVVADQDAHVVKFGNVCFVEDTADFDTKGYWHNKNGIGELTADANVFADVIAYVNSLAPYVSPSGYFGKGDEPFDGVDEFGDPVPAGKGVLDNEDIADAGTIEAEISNFLIDSVGNGGIREQLAQQLLAFIFNVHYRLGGTDAMIVVDGGVLKSASEIIGEAVEAWLSSDAVWQNTMAGLLDGFNNDDAVAFVIISAEPCEFEPVPCECVVE